MNAIEKQIVLCVVLLVPIPASSAIACRAGVVTPVPGAATNFVRTGFSPKCSANTDVHYNDDGSNFAVQAASSKGLSVFGGTTAGGDIRVCSTVSNGVPVAHRPPAGDTPC